MDFDATHDEPLGDAAGDDSAYDAYSVPPVAEFGTEQATAYDWDGDGVQDSLVGYLEGIGSFDATDFDQDGDIDYLAVDTDGDGQYDVLITNNYDTGGYDVQWDSDGDGSLDATQTVTAEDIQAASLDLWNLINEHYTPLDPSVPDVQVWYPEVVDGQIPGDPFAEGDLWFVESWDGSVVPASVVEIYNYYSETTITTTEFVQVVNGYDGGGWATGPGGAPGLTSEVVVGVLGDAGVPATASYGSMTVLAEAVATSEYSMIVAYEGVDGVAMATVTSYSEEYVYLSATTVSGEAVAVPTAAFDEAWAVSGYSMVECTQTVAEYHEAQGIATNGYQAYSEYSSYEASSYESSTVVQQAVAGPWALLPVSGATMAQAARG
jgi:hypothetical protein